MNGPALSDGAAANLVQPSALEPRPDNAAANGTMPTEADLARLRAQDSMPYTAYITGHHTGTTDENLQWGARKWGLDPQLLRAVAAVETWWHMSSVGDQGDSFGIFQIRRPYHCCADLAAGSTAFSADYFGAQVRSYMDGKETWLNNISGNGQPYVSGDLWGAVGAWGSGRWHNAGAQGYIARVQADLQSRPWLSQDF